MQYMHKQNEKCVKSFKHGLVVNSSPFPQWNEGSILIVAKLNKVKWGKWGDFKRLIELAQFEFDYLEKKI